MAQQFNAIVQYTLGRSYVVQLSYFGTKGTTWTFCLDPIAQLRDPPAREASRIPIQNALANIQLDESIGKSIYNAGRRR